MAERTEISWCDSTFNPWIGCTRVSPACDNCYASVSTPTRTLGIAWGAEQGCRRTTPGNWNVPLRWNAKPFWQCQACGWRGEETAGLSSFCPGCCSGVLVPARRRVFCASLADVFDNEVPDQWRWDLFELIRATPNLDWLLLTKRVGNARTMLNAAAAAVMGASTATPWDRSPWPNVWLGAAICNQGEADRDIPKLLQVPAALRFLSLEPLLDEIELTHVQWPGKHRVDVLRGGAWDVPGWIAGFTNHSDMARIDWVIAGGESGSNARPMSPDWARSLRDQCAAAEVPFTFKQWGEWLPMLGQAEGVPVRDKTTTRDGWVMGRAGKRAAGRRLDGREHNGFPATTAR